MYVKRWLAIAALITVLTATCLGSGDIGTGRSLFEDDCSGCHSIGKGVLVGPDLKDVTKRRSVDWLRQIISGPDQQTGDPIRRQLQKKFEVEMPNLGLSEAEVNDLLAFLVESGKKAPIKQSVEEAPLEFTPEDRSRGKSLFSGATALEKGAPPCSTCHKFSPGGISTGTLAVDLGRLRGRNPDIVLAMVKSASFPLMRTIYKRQPLSNDEIHALTAFLVFNGADASPSNKPSPIPVAGTLFAVLIAAVIGFSWRKSDEEMD